MINKLRKMLGKDGFLNLKGAILMGFGFFFIGMVAMSQFCSISIFHRKISAEEPNRPTSAEIGRGTNKFAMAAYKKLPLTFIPNAGQTDSRVHYYSQGQDYVIYFTPEEVIFTFARKVQWNGRFEIGTMELMRNRNFSMADKSYRELARIESQYYTTMQNTKEVHLAGFALALRFLGANPEGRLTGGHELTGKINYFIDDDPAMWHTGLSTYQEMIYHDLWQGVDLVFGGDNGQLKYEFILQPGAKLEDIKFTFDGSEDIYLNQAGDLLIKTLIGTLTDKRPWSYQLIEGEQVPVESSFVVQRHADGRNVCAFEIGWGYDPRYPLVIDPKLVYSTFLGGENNDEGLDIAVDNSGNAYVAGIAGFAAEFPTTVGAFDTTHNSGFQDVFVAKLDPTGIRLIYSTFLGGGGIDRGIGIDVDALGNAYITGITGSFDFPTINAFDTSCDEEGSSPSFGACQDAFVAKLDATGANLLYSTYLGGTDENDFGRDIAVDASGNAYVTGDTQSLDFPTLSSIFVGPPDDPSFDGGSPNVGEDGVTFQDAFVVKFDINGSPIFSTLLGGSGAERGLGIAVDALGNAYVTGDTISEDFPTTDGAFDTSKNDVFDTDAFVAKLGFNGRAKFIYSTYLGGSDEDLGKDIDIDANDNAYVIGSTRSADFPTTVGVFDPVGNSDNDVFITKIDDTGTSLVYSTYFGGVGTDEGNSIAVDSSGNAYVTGRTFSNDFPVTDDALDLMFNDVFVGKLDSVGANLLFGTFLGASGIEVGNGIAVDSSGNVYVTGETGSRDFPTTGAAFDTSCGTDGVCNLGFDTFVVKFELVPTPTPTPKQIPIATTMTVNPTEAARSIRPMEAIVTVLDQNGQPLGGVIVNADADGRRVIVEPESATTSDDGTARFEFRFGIVTTNGKITFSVDGADDINVTITKI